MDNPAEPSAPPPSEPELDRLDAASRRRQRLRQVGTIMAVIIIATGGLAWATGGFTRSAGKVLSGIGPQCPPTVPLNGSGSTFILPLMTKWIQAYTGAAASRNSGCVVVRPTYDPSSSGPALGEFGVGGTEFVATEQPMNTSAESGLSEPTLTLPLALGAVAVAYNLPGVPSGLNLTGTVLAAIFLGEITAWDNPAIASMNPGISLPTSTAITVIHEGAGSSTNYVFTGFLSASNTTWASEVGQGSTVAWPTGVMASGDAGAASLLENTTGAIAFLGLGAALSHGLDCAKVQNPAGAYVAPSPASIFAAATAYSQTLPLGNESWANVSLLDLPGTGSYPITTFTYAIVYEDLGKGYNGALTLNVAQWLAAFLYWMSVAGQNYGTLLGYAPFSSVVTNANQQIVELLKYDGVPALGDVDYDGD